MSDNFAWVCICILEGANFSIPDADADARMIVLALTPNYLFSLHDPLCIATFLLYQVVKYPLHTHISLLNLNMTGIPDLRRRWRT